MKKIILTALMTAPIMFAGVAFAQDGPPPEDKFAEADINGDGVITQSELAQNRTAKFAEADANGDGLISFDEAMAVHKERSADKPGRGGPGNPVAKMFSHMDIDGDGFVSVEETEVLSNRRFKDMDADLNGEVTLLEAKAAARDMMKDRDHKGPQSRR